MKRRILSVILLITVSIFFVVGCGSKSDESNGYYDTSSDVTVESKTTAKSETAAVGTETKDSGESVKAIEAPETKYTAGSDDTMKLTTTSKLDTVDSGVPVDFVEPLDPVEPVEPIEPVEPEYNNNKTAGLLTAGEWNDNNNWTFFSNLIANNQLITPSFGMNPMNRIIVTVLSTEGSPVKNARVELLNTSKEVIWKAVSDYNGIAYVFFNLLNDNQVPASLNISKNGISSSTDLVLAQGLDGQNPNSQSQYRIYQDVTVTIDDTSNTKALDLMFVFDTTGSMGDELRYLQTEFEDIAKKVADQNTRYSINFYRDEGDEYVVKSNEFTYNSELVLSQLNQEFADGGGDYPEAVEQALYDGIMNHDWNSDSVKLLFLILDAPPHSGDTQINDTLQKSIIEAANQGIRIIPVASSGVDKDTETFLRTIAILTGGTYTFLTDHSGIGDSHLEPTIGNYQVENLNDCIVRIIKTYYQ